MQRVKQAQRGQGAWWSPVAAFVWAALSFWLGSAYCPDRVKIWNINARMHAIDIVNVEAEPC
jgi:hypothetical protein